MSLFKNLFLSLTLLAVTTQAADTLRVMSFNVRYGNAKDGPNHWNLRKERCAARVTAFKPDLLGLQEALNFQNDYILQSNPQFKLIGVGREDGKEKGEYSSILYNSDRLEPLESGTFWLSETPDVAGSKSWDSSLPRIATWARFKDKARDGKEFIALNTHFDHRGPIARLKAAAMIRDFVTAKSGTNHLPVIVTGDFNSSPKSEAHKTLVEKQKDKVELTDTYIWFHQEKPEPNEGTAHGYSEKLPATRIDWILCSPDFTIEDSAIDRTHEGKLFPSDHFAVNAVLRWK